MEAVDPKSMSDVLMEMDDNSVLRWEIPDFLERWRQTETGDIITSGPFLLKTEDGRETLFFLQLGRVWDENNDVHLRYLYGQGEWKRLFDGRPLWIEREDGTKSAAKSKSFFFFYGLHLFAEIELDWRSRASSKIGTPEEIAEFGEGETLTICVRLEPPTAVFPVQLQPLLSLSQHHIGQLPSFESYGRAFEWKTEVTVEKLVKFILELRKEAEEGPWYEDAMQNWAVATLTLPQLPPNAQEVIVKYDLWLVEENPEGDYEPEEERLRTFIKGNIAHFAADRSETTIEFDGTFREYWEGRLDLLVHGYQIVPKLPPPLRMDEGGPLSRSATTVKRP
ncbi:hypothetical protein M3Y99_01211100 [Aphelenchoides fujianensis]|nr:hypothetical protein M3Y99_01211100 [Aphelenchoides fujianensis]